VRNIVLFVWRNKVCVLTLGKGWVGGRWLSKGTMGISGRGSRGRGTAARAMLSIQQAAAIESSTRIMPGKRQNYSYGDGHAITGGETKPLMGSICFFADTGASLSKVVVTCGECAGRSVGHRPQYALFYFETQRQHARLLHRAEIRCERTALVDALYKPRD
jgi:hypothetical protein